MSGKTVLPNIAYVDYVNMDFSWALPYISILCKLGLIKTKDKDTLNAKTPRKTLKTKNIRAPAPQGRGPEKDIFPPYAVFLWVLLSCPTLKYHYQVI